VKGGASHRNRRTQVLGRCMNLGPRRRREIWCSGDGIVSRCSSGDVYTQQCKTGMPEKLFRIGQLYIW